MKFPELEMPATPEPNNEIKSNLNTNIDITNLKNKNEFKYKEFKLITGLLNDNIIFHCKSDKNENQYQYQIKLNYREIINDIPNFKILTNISDIYKLILKLLNSERYDIKIDNNYSLKLILKIINMIGNEEAFEIILNKMPINPRMKAGIMEEKIINLENKINELIIEKDEMSNKINELNKENQIIKKELSDLKIKINSLIFVSLNLNANSQIIDSPEEIIFILKEIERNNKKIKDIKLIYTAKEDGDITDIFHSKCDDKMNTLMLIKTNSEYKFGGFTKTGWKNDKGKDIYDEKAFCFSINLKRIYNISNPKFALHCQSVDGRPSFGSNNYVFLLGNNFLSKSTSKVEAMNDDYIGEKKKMEINGGKEYFQVEELEVFQIFF